MSTVKRETRSDSSTSESEVSSCSSNYNPIKALYSDKVKVPVESAPLYENIAQFEAAQVQHEIIPFGKTELVVKREEEKERKRIEEQKWLEEKNKQRFAQYKGLEPKKKELKVKNVLTRIEHIEGPLAMLKEWLDKSLRVQIITRNDRDVRGVLIATIVAFDKHWNLALSDVLEIWKKKTVNKRKTPPGMGTPVPKGTAATISPVPETNEYLVSSTRCQVECSRRIPQMMVRGEHIVLVHVLQ